jgi:selenocysteine-specific elongation factor
VAGTFLAKSEIVDVDAPAGRGVDNLRSALDRLVDATPTAVDRGRPRLWVDRSFSARGSGTVVTGTLTGGSLEVGEELLVIGPTMRGPHRVRVRALQSHNETRAAAGPGRRVAVNLSGLAHERPYRGDALVRPGQWFMSRRLDCSLGVLATLDHEVSRRGAYQAYLGSGEHPVGVRVLGGQALAPGTEGHVRLHLPVALPLLPGDRYVLRESGRSETVGGGEILDVDPLLPASKAAPSRSVSRVLAERGWVEVEMLERLTGERRPPDVAGRWVVDPAALDDVSKSVRAAVAGAGPLGLDLASFDDRQRAVAATLEGVLIEGGRARPASTGAAQQTLATHPYLAALRAEPFSPPGPEGRIERAELRELVRLGLVVERDGCYFAVEAVDQAARVVARLLRNHPEGVTVASVRDALGTTRKFLLPLLAHLDGSGVTRRRGGLRVAGPRVPAS